MATVDTTFSISHRQHPTDQSEASFPHGRSCIAFALACIQFPPPPDSPELPPSTLEQFGMLCLAVLLLFALVLLILPGKWSRKVIKVAFCIGKGHD